MYLNDPFAYRRPFYQGSLCPRTYHNGYYSLSHFVISHILSSLSIWFHLSLALQFHIPPSLWPLAQSLLPPPSSSRSSNRWSFVAWGLLWGPSVLGLPTGFGVSLLTLPVSVTLSFLRDRVVSPAPSPQPGGPGGHTLSGLYPLTCSAWVILPRVQDSRRHSSRGH